MRILTACDPIYGQTMAEELGALLAADARVERLAYGTELFRAGPGSFDLLHIHWPEALLNWRPPTAAALDGLASLLGAWRTQARVAVTCHDRITHHADSELARRLYRLVYEAAHGVIHLGKASVENFRADYPELTHPQHTVIPHKIYSSYPDTQDRAEARSLLGVDPSRPLMLFFGAMRHPREARLLFEGFRRARIPGKLLVTARKVRYSRNPIVHHLLAAPLLLRRDILRFEEQRVPNERVQTYMNAADVVVLPRIGSLNSGVLVLAFGFGRCVAGPDEGVIGEILRESGNPAYPPGDQEGLARAFERGIELARAGIGESNRSLARDRWNDQMVTTQHIEFFRRLLA